MEPAKLFVAVYAIVLGEWVMTACASTQPLIPLAPPPPPIFNPSSPSTTPQTNGTPVSPNASGVLPRSGVQRRSSFCGVFHRGPCFPEYLPPIGQDLRLTIVSTDENDPASKSDGDAINDVRGDKADDEKKLELDSRDVRRTAGLLAATAKGFARHGMEYTVRFAFKRDGEIMAQPRVTYSSHEAPAEVRDVYRDAVNAALTRCTPLHFSKGMGGAVAGRPIAIRFVDDRTINNGKTLQ